MTNREVEEIKGHFDKVSLELRSEMAQGLAGVRAELSEFRRDAAAVADHLMQEMRRGFAGVRAEIHRLHETDDELLRRIEAREQRDA